MIDLLWLRPSVYSVAKNQDQPSEQTQTKLVVSLNL